MKEPTISAVIDRIEADTCNGKRFETLQIDGRRLTPDEAYGIQARIVARATDRGAGAIVGYKVGLTSKTMQQFCGISEPVAGCILENRIQGSDIMLEKAKYHRLGLESELALRLSKPVPILGNNEDARALIECIDAVATAFEIIDDRDADYSNLDALSIVAENSWNQGMILGQAVDATAAGDLDALAGRLLLDGQVIATGCSGDVLEGPLSVIAWLARSAKANGFELKPGQWVMTGSIIPTVFARPGQSYRFELGALPVVQVAIT